MKNSGTFVRTLLPSDANNIISLLDFNQILAPYQLFEADHIIEHAIVLEDFQVKVGLFSLLEADWPETNALSTQAAQEAEQARIKKEGQKIYLGCYHAYGNGPWIKKGEEILQNKNSLEQPWALMSPFFSTNETALIDEDLKIGVRIESKAQGNGGLKGSDYLTFFGSWRKVTNIKKKDDSLESLSDRISALESLISVFGAPSASLPGSNGLVPAPPAGGEGHLLRGDRSWKNPDELVDKISTENVGGAKTFSEILTVLKEVVARGVGSLSGYATRTAATLFSTAGGSYLSLSCSNAPTNNKLIDLELNSTGIVSFRRINDNYTGLVSNIFQVDSSGNMVLPGFTTLGAGGVSLKTKLIAGTTATTQGAFVQISHGLDGGKIVATILSVNFAASQWLTANYNLYPGYECSLQHTNIAITVGCVSGNSANVLGKPFTVLIFYTN